MCAKKKPKPLQQQPQNRNSMNWNDYVKQRKQTLSERWIELFNEGKRPSIIMETMQKETGLNKYTLYRILSVKELKKEAAQLCS